MKSVHTTERTALARLYAAASQAQPNKAALAALITEAFVNGMTAQEALTCDNAATPAQHQT